MSEIKGCRCHHGGTVNHERTCPQHWLNDEPREPAPGDPSPGLADHKTACLDVESRAVAVALRSSSRPR